MRRTGRTGSCSTSTPTHGDVAGARHATARIRELLAEFEVDGFPVATGSSGFHVWVPLAGCAAGGGGRDGDPSARQPRGGARS